MLAFLETIREEHKDDDEVLIALGEIESELNAKKYGLVWERHEEAVDVQMRDNIPVFTECVEKEISSATGSVNFLLEGDNLHSLRLLEKTHAGRIDVIYIDPPYNTGSKDFIYDDHFVVKEDGYRHSKWLSFMESRLQIAQRLLSARGTIFISIDDNEQAQLKLLCDEIFGEQCFVADIAWQRTYSMRNDAKGIPSEKEHLLVYSKFPQWNPRRLPRTAEMDSNYKNPDNDKNGDWQNTSPFAPDANTHQGMVYAIQHPITGELMYPNVTAHWRYSQEAMLSIMSEWARYKLEDIDDLEKRAEICGLSKEKVRKDIKAIILDEDLETAKAHALSIYKRGNWPRFFFTKNGYGGIRRKTYKENLPGKVPTNYWPFAETGHTDEAKKELKAIFAGGIPFDTPKPTRLVDRIIYIASYDDSIILDFFAGSGTTGHAVLKHNFENGGNRRFILCTNNENNICEEVTYERIKRVIEGYGDTEGIPANLKYYRTDFVSKDSDALTDELLDHIKEMIQLEHGIKLDGSQYIMVLTDEEADALEQHWDEYKDVKALYVSRNVLFTTEQNVLFGDVDIHIIPDDYFKFELQEVGESW